MMDYLTSLVARNLELLEVIQPRLASRFEPSGLTAGSLHGGSSWRDTTVEAQPAAQSETRDHILKTSPALSSERPLESHRPLRDFQNKASNRRQVQAQGQQSSQGAAPPLVDVRDGKVAVQTRHDLIHAQLGQPPWEPTHPGDLLLTPSKKLPDLLPEHVIMPAAVKNTALSRSSGGAQQEQRASLQQTIQPALPEYASPVEGGPGTESPLLATPQIAKPRGVVAPPQVVPLVQAAPSPLAASASLPQAAPVIRVTIGRVEVRAVMAPQAPSPPRPQVRSGPSLSLEDYLKERGEGKR